MAAAAWGMENFNKYLKGSRLTLYMDPKTAQDLGNTQVKTLNRLKTAMSDHNFDTRNRQKADPGMIESVSKFLLNETISNGA